jgi:uncharacterized membrane protein YjjB (DUF3815 family)
MMLNPGSVFLQAALGFITTAGFAMLFNVPRRTLLACGLVGAGGHALRYSLQTLGVSTEVATFTGALIVGLVGYAEARRFHLPRLVFTVTGIITMVPGIPAYEVLVFFSEGDTLGGLQAAVRVGLVTGAIAAGLGMARVLVDMEWRHLG